jgi:hypothetical protein
MRTTIILQHVVINNMIDLDINDSQIGKELSGCGKTTPRGLMENNRFRRA